MVYELVTWLQTDMDAVDEGHLSAALETVVPASAVEGAAGGGGEGGRAGDGAGGDEDDSVASTEVCEPLAGLTLQDRGAGAAAGGGGGRSARAGGAGRGGGGAGAADVKARGEEMKRREERKKEDAAWQRMQVTRAKLPAWKQAEEVVKAVRANSVTVISGETGCGKTTQVPQFILDDLIRSGAGGAANIVCTQPRRLSAVGVAERVARERGEGIGQSVGYQIRLESKKSADTCMLFCTTGILLRRLSEDTELGGVSHVIVDEVHERSVDGDFLLILLARLVRR